MFGINEKLDLIESLEKNGISDKDYPVLEKLSKSLSKEVRWRVAELLSQKKITNGEEILLNLCRDKKHLVRVNACDSIKIYDDPRCYEQLLNNIHDKNDLVISYAIGSATVWIFSFAPEKREDLREVLNSVASTNGTYMSALHCAKYALGDESMSEYIDRDLKNPDPYVQARTLHNLNLIEPYCDISSFLPKIVDLAQEARTTFVKNAAEEFLSK